MTKFSKFSLFALLALVSTFMSCNNDDDDEVELVGNWVKVGAFEGLPRRAAVSFVIEDTAYVGLGYNKVEDKLLTDFWKYDADKDYWYPIENSFPGQGRKYAVAFSAGGKGYVGTGLGIDSLKDDLRLKDFYEYDPATGSWTEVASFKGSARYGAVAFSANGKGYVGTGYDGSSTQRDFYQYDPSINDWTKVASMGGDKRQYAVAFTINNEGYVVTGFDNGGYKYDFYKYSPENDAWTELRMIGDISDESYDDDYEIVCQGAVAFTNGNMAYLATGSTTSAGNKVWEYNPVSDEWTEKTEFEGNSRVSAVAFTVKDKGYVACGNGSSYDYDDIWMLEPDVEQDDMDNY